jgi:hypothetical protein
VHDAAGGAAFGGPRQAAGDLAGPGIVDPDAELAGEGHGVDDLVGHGDHRVGARVGVAITSEVMA